MDREFKRRRAPWSLAAAALVAAAAAAVPAGGTTRAEFHYIVLELAADGGVEPLFHARVSLQHSRPTKSEESLRRALAVADGGEELLALRVIDDHEVVYRDLVPVTRELRGEFHGTPIGGGFAIDHSRHRVERAIAVARVPVRPEARLEIVGRRTTILDLDELEADAGGLPLAGFAPELGLVGSVVSGDPGNRVDLLIMGDGYTAGQLADFSADAAALQSAFFANTPYAEYANYVNVSTLFTASSQPGADHPPYNPSCVGDDPSCCADPGAAADPLAGSYVATAFDGRYCAFNIHRLLVADASKVMAAAAAVPDWDMIFVVVNDSTYGGSGGLVSVSSTHANAPDVVRHEFGHSFTDLADEYDSAYPGYPACSDLSSPPCEANVTDVTTRVAIKWEPWIEASTPVPTPENAGYGGVVGLFEGARYRTTGMYRPRDTQCLMHYLGVPFCEVCAQSYVLKLYDGGWGDPNAGIDLIEPGSESPPPGVVPVVGASSFSVQLLEPIGGPPDVVEWSVDGAVQGGATGDTFVFTPPHDGSYQLSVSVTDGTTLVHPAMAGSSLSSARTWTVEATVAALIFSDGFESGGTGAWSSAVP